MIKDALWEEFAAKYREPLKLTDFSGCVRLFELHGYKTNCYSILAKETAESGGKYEFSGSSYVSPYEALERLVEKARITLATRYLDAANPPNLLHHACVGRVQDGGVVVDGTHISWERLSEIMQAYEGWDFNLSFPSE